MFTYNVDQSNGVYMSQCLNIYQEQKYFIDKQSVRRGTNTG